VSDNRFTDNAAYLAGGGVRFCFFGVTMPRPRVARNLVRGNTAFDGAGIQCQDVDSLTIAECVIVANQASGRGGGLMVDAQTTVGLIGLVGCTLEGNAANSHGGGVLVDAGNVELSSCIVAANTGYGLVLGNGSPLPSLLSDYCDVWNNSWKALI